MYGPSQVVALPVAASGTAIRYSLPGGERTEIEGLSFTLATAAGGGNRQVVARIQDGLGVDVYAVAAPGLQAGGLLVVYSFAPLVPAFGTAALGFMGGPFPRACSGDPLFVVVTVGNPSGGDAVQDARLTVKQYPLETDSAPEE